MPWAGDVWQTAKVLTTVDVKRTQAQRKSPLIPFGPFSALLWASPGPDSHIRGCSALHWDQAALDGTPANLPARYRDRIDFQ
jgi:hypothetical protein